MCVLEQVTVEVVEGQAFVTAVAGDAMLGKKALKRGEKARLPECALLTLFAPKDEGESESKEGDEEEEQKDDEKGAEMEDEKEDKKEDDMTERVEDEGEEKEEETKEETKEEMKDKETDEETKDEVEEKKGAERERVATLAVLVEEHDPRKMDNYLFYKGKLRSRPDRCLVGDFHRKWRHDFDRLEYEHGFIQWLFPLFLGLPHTPSTRH